MTADLLTFLRARLDEDQRLASGGTWGEEADWNLLGGMESGLARYVARQAPERALAEVESKRLMIRDVAAAQASSVDMEYACCHEPAQILAGECPGFEPDKLPLLRLLALPYADHPGYQESWRP